MSRLQDDGLIVEGTVMARNRRLPDTGFLPIGNVTALKLKTESEKKTRTSKQKGSYGQALDTITIKKPTTVSFTLDTFDKTNLAMVLMGADSVVEASAVKTTDQPVTVTKKGIWISLGHANLDPTKVIVKNAAGTKVDEADYELNANIGLVLIKESCTTVQDGEEVKITHTTKAGGGFHIDADKVSDWDLEIMVDTTNRVNGKEGKLHIPSAVIASDSELDWFADDFNSASFSGNTVLVAGYPSSYSYSEFN